MPNDVPGIGPQKARFDYYLYIPKELSVLPTAPSCPRGQKRVTQCAVNEKSAIVLHTVGLFGV